MKGKDLISIVHSKAQQSRHYAHAFASYLASKSQIVNDIYQIALLSYREGGAVNEDDTLNSDIITNDLVNIPVWIRPLSIDGIEREYDQVCITFEHYIRAINGKISSDSPNEAEVPLSYGSRSVTFKEYLEFEGFNLAPLDSGITNNLQYTIPITIQIGEEVYNKGDVIEFSVEDLDNICIIPSHTLPIIKFSILESLQNQVQSVVSCNSTVAMFEALASKDNPTVSDISDAIQQAVGNFSGYEEYVDRDMLTAAKNVSLSGSERIHQLVSLMNERLDENESDLVNDVYYDEDIKMLFNSQNYSGMTPITMFNAANVSSTIKNVFMTTGAIIKAAVKVVLSAAKSIFRAVGRLWRKYVTPIYKSKDFVKTEYSDSDTHVDLPLFAVGDQSMGIQFKDLDLITPTLKMFNDIDSIEGKFNPKGISHELNSNHELFMYYDDPNDQGIASFEVNRTVNSKRVANITLSTGSDGEYTQYIYPDQTIKSTFQKNSDVRNSSDDIMETETCVGIRGNNGVLKVYYDENTYRNPPVEFPGDTVLTDLPSTVFDKVLEHTFHFNEETGYYYTNFEKFKFSWNEKNLVMYGVSANGVLSHPLLDIIPNAGSNVGLDCISHDSTTELGYSVESPSGMECDYLCKNIPFHPDSPADEFNLKVGYSYPFNHCALSVKIVIYHEKIQVKVQSINPLRHSVGSNGLITFKAPGTIKLAPVLIYDADFPIKIDENGDIINLNDGSKIVNTKYDTVTLPGLGSTTLSCNAWDISGKEHFNFNENEFTWDVLLHFRPSICDEAIASFHIPAECKRGVFYGLWLDKYFTWTFDSGVDSLQTIKNDTLYYGNGNVKFIWSDNLKFVFYPPTVSMLNETTLAKLYSEISCPVDNGTALVIKNNFFSMQILNRDGLIRSQCYLTPVNYNVLYDGEGFIKLGLNESNLITWKRSAEQTDTAYDDEEVYAIFEDIFSATSEVRNSYDEEKGDVNAYNDLVCSKRLTDMYSWCLANPDLDVREYISDFIVEKRFYMFTGTEELVFDEVNNESFYNLLWNDGNSVTVTVAVNFIRDVLILAITNKPNVMRAMYYLTGTFPEFIPYSIGDRLQMPRWHVSNDKDIQGYIEKVCAGVLIVAAVIASSILLKQAAKKTARFFDKQRRKSDAKLFNAQSKTRAADVKLSDKKKELSDLDDWIKEETDPDTLKELRAMRKELVDEKKGLSKIFSKVANQEVKQALRTKRWTAVCKWLGVNTTAAMALDVITSDESSSKAKQEEVVQQCSVAEELDFSSSNLSTRDDVSELKGNVEQGFTDLKTDVNAIESYIAGLGLLEAIQLLNQVINERLPKDAAFDAGKHDD